MRCVKFTLTGSGSLGIFLKYRICYKFLMTRLRGGIPKKDTNDDITKD